MASMAADVLATIVVPLTPSPVLSPNARVHWAKRAKQAGLCRTAAAMATTETLDRDARKAIADVPHIGYRIEIHWEPGRRGVRDEDNALSSCKAILDGIADSLGIDDSRLHVRGIVGNKQTRRGVTIVTLLDDGGE
jgi:hypothetical protein